MMLQLRKHTISDDDHDDDDDDDNLSVATIANRLSGLLFRCVALYS